MLCALQIVLSTHLSLVSRRARFSKSVGMDATPGGKDENKVPASLRRGQEVDVGDRVLLLMGTITFTIFTFISQVCSLIFCKYVQHCC